MTRRKPKAKAGSLDGLAAKLDGLPPARRKALEMEIAKIQRRADYKGAKRGPRPKLGETMSEVVVVKCTPALKAEIADAARGLGFDNAADYFRELHRRHVGKGGAR